MRHTFFRRRMAEEFGEIRADTLSRDLVLASLGERTIDEALDSGWEPKQVWWAVCEAFEIPAARR